MEKKPRHLYEFGAFRLDADERLLLRAGEVVALAPKTFDVLLALVEQSGHLLEKEELLKTVWPDSFVEENNLADNISKLRKALGEGENGYKFIETVPKRGYRFVGDVRRVSDAALPPIEEYPQSAPLTGPVKDHRIGSFLRRAVSVIALGILAFGVYKFIARSERIATGPKIIPVTSLPGSESQPVFSPDGNQIAFVWDGLQENNSDIYVKLIDVGEPLRLTTNPAPDLNPVWSPDGRYIAFTREGEESGVYLVPALGGAERKMTDIFRERPVYKLSLSYSPDGKYLAIADRSALMEPFSIFLLSTVTGEKRRLTIPPTGPHGDDTPAFSPDGQNLAFLRSFTMGLKDLYVMSLAGGEATRLTFGNKMIEGITWTADSCEIIYSSGSLWKVAVAGGALEPLPVFAPNLFQAAISRQGNRLAWRQDMNDLNLWRREINPATGKAEAPVKLIASSAWDGAPQYSPDGQRIAFASSRMGSTEVWISDRNGEKPFQLTNRGSTSSTPRWSPDGRLIAFDSLEEGQWDVYLVSSDGGTPRRFTTETAEDSCPSWSRDGQWIYFGSARSGSRQIWKMPAAGGEAMQITKQGGYEGFESPDGKYFYYTKARRTAGIWRILVTGGEETLVLDQHKAGYWRYWAVTEQGLYFATAEAPARPVLEFFNFATGRITPVATLDKQIHGGIWGMTVSPDGRSILYSQYDQRGSDIMVMENFR